MPRSFSNWNEHRRPNPRLFAVNHVTDVTHTDDVEEELGMEQSSSLHDLKDLVDNLLEDDADEIFGLDQLSHTSADMFARSSDSLSVFMGSNGATLSSNGTGGAGGAVGAGGASASEDTSSAGTPAPALCMATLSTANGVPVAPEPQAEFLWLDQQNVLHTTDGWGRPIGARHMPTAALNPFEWHVALAAPLLYWAERRQWMWHKKWALPALSIRVRRRDPGCPEPLLTYVMVTAGTLRDEHPELHDQGLSGECQRRLEFDSAGHAEVTFTRLFFQQTSFNCGNRPIRLVVTILSGSPPHEPDGMPSDRPDTMADAKVDVAAGATGTLPPSAPLVPLACVCSSPVHVDARKRSKGERPEAKDDDVRLAQRQRPLTAMPNAAPPAHQPTGLVGWLGRIAQGGGHTAGHNIHTAGHNIQTAGHNIHTTGHTMGVPGHSAAVPIAAPMPALMDAAGDAFVEVTAEGMVVRVLGTAVFGYTPDQLVGRSFFSLCHPDDSMGLLQTMQALLLMASAQAQPGSVAAVGSWRSVRVLHRVLTGIGGQRPPEQIAVDSIVSVTPPTLPSAPSQTLLVCSRAALPIAAEPVDAFSFQVRCKHRLLIRCTLLCAVICPVHCAHL